MYIDKQVLQILFGLHPEHRQAIEAAWESYKSQIEDIYFASIMRYINAKEIQKPAHPTLVKLAEYEISEEDKLDETTEKGQALIAAMAYIATTEEFAIIFEAAVKDFNQKLIDKITPNLSEEIVDKLDAYLAEAESNAKENQKIYSDIIKELKSKYEPLDDDINDDENKPTGSSQGYSIDDLINSVNPK